MAGLHLGGTRIHAVVMDGEEIRGSSRLKTPTSGDREAVLDVLAAAVHDACDDAGLASEQIDGLGVCTPGVVIDGTVGGASNVPGFLERFALADRVEQRTGLSTSISNDASAAAVAEHRLGAGRDADDLLAVFVGAGVGGGLILEGRPYFGRAGGAGEIGHMVVRAGGAVCPCGRRGCLEAYAGRRAIARTAERARSSGRGTVLFEVQAELGLPLVTSGVLQEALQRGDELTADLLDDAVWALGTGIASAINLLDVDRVVLGGGLADRLGDPFRLRIDAAARPLLFLQPPRLKITAAELGDRAGAVGAALLAA